MTSRGGAFLYRNERASRRLSRAGIGTSMDADSRDVDLSCFVVGSGSGVENLGLANLISRGKMNLPGTALGMMGDLRMMGLVEGGR